jgi:transcriptional regulator NrdR family protein
MGDYVRRRYHCKNTDCGSAWTTAEVFVHAEAKQVHRGVEKALAQQANVRALATFEQIAKAVRSAFK